MQSDSASACMAFARLLTCRTDTVSAASGIYPAFDTVTCQTDQKRRERQLRSRVHSGKRHMDRDGACRLCGRLAPKIERDRHPCEGKTPENCRPNLHGPIYGGAGSGISAGHKSHINRPAGDEYISMDEIAGRLETINYEVACTISSRVPRMFLENGSIMEVRNPLLQVNISN